MNGVDLEGVEIVKNNPTATGGPGGVQPPRALQDKRRGVGRQF